MSIENRPNSSESIIEPDSLRGRIEKLGPGKYYFCINNVGNGHFAIDPDEPEWKLTDGVKAWEKLVKVVTSDPFKKDNPDFSEADIAFSFLAD
jgi:hypothetical protein